MKIVTWAFTWAALFGLWLVLSAGFVWDDILLGAVAAALLASVPGIFPTFEKGLTLAGLQTTLRSWLPILTDWPHLVWALKPVGRFEVVEGGRGAYLGSIGGARYVVGSADDNRLLVHVLGPGDES